MTGPYWQGDNDVPFKTLLTIVRTYCHPEAAEDAYETLIRRAGKSDKYPEMVTFKDELRRVILGDTHGLPAGALGQAAAYEDGSQEKFARRLWGDLYPGEPVPGS
jgi:hypothetical protein